MLKARRRDDDAVSVAHTRVTGWFDSVFGGAREQGRSERGPMAAALFLLFAAGIVLAVIALVLSGYLSAGERIVVLFLCVFALAACTVIALWWRRLPPWAFQLLLASGTVVVSVGTYVSSALPGDTEMFYIWVALYASYYFTRVQALVQVAFVGLCYATVLAVDSSSGAEAPRWAITMGTLAVTALLFDYLSGQLRRRVAEKERSERELEKSLSMYEATVESTADGILVVDREGAIVSFNRKFQEMWRIPDEIVRSRDDQRAIEFVCEQLTDPEQFVRKVQQLYDRPEAESQDILRFKDGRVFERYSQPQRAGDGEVHGRVWSFRDITERERTQSRLRHLAEHDPLTGLLNRRRFEEEVSKQIAYAGRYEGEGAVLLLDLDDFKYVNDRLGHRSGDALISSIADLLRSRLRASDTICRLGGDEFAVLLPRADERRARLVGEGLLDIVRRHRTMIRGQPLRVTTSIGIAVFGHSGSHAAEELLMQADVAMYKAKEAGRDRLEFFRDTDWARQTADANLGWSERIRRALDEDRLILHAQPILDLHTGKVSQYELLVRMIGTDGHLLPPRAFLPSAERSGLVREIDSWVTHQAIDLIDRHRRASREVRLEVNLSGLSLGDPTLAGAIEEELRRTGIDPTLLIFEVTETAASVNLEAAREFATTLSRFGCRFALDDFGAGFGSFYYLKYLPVDLLKIDGDFIGGLEHNPTDQAVVCAIVDLSHRLGMQTVAECVDGARTEALLREYAVDFAQGFSIGHPFPVEEMLQEAPGEAPSVSR